MEEKQKTDSQREMSLSPQEGPGKVLRHPELDLPPRGSIVDGKMILPLDKDQVAKSRVVKPELHKKAGK